MSKIASRTSSFAGQTDQEKNGDNSSGTHTETVVVADPVLEVKVWRKLDMWVLPIASMFYLLSFLDRTNFGNARVAGLQNDLKITNRQYSIALTVTYVPYIAAELPSNLLLRIVGPNLMLPTMLTLCGVVTTLQGLVRNYQGLLACRFFLGLLEGGIFPGLILYLSFFYPRQRLNMRITTFFSSASVSGAFSGLLAFGIINMNGIGGRPGWAWIFILEGLFTVVFGITSFFLLPRSPSSARFLSQRERVYVVAKLREDGSTARDDATDAFSWREVGQAFTLPQVWFLAITLFFNGAILYSLAYFTPSIIQGLGYTPARVQLMSVPPFAAAFAVSITCAFISDRYHCRGLINAFCCVLCIIGFSMFLGSAKHHVQYASLFFSISGIYCSAAALSTWMANNAAPHARRATAVALAFIMTNSGGILATWLLGALSAPPRYTKASIVLLVFAVLMLLLTLANIGYLWTQNQRKVAVRASIARSEEREGLGDRSAWFIYSL